MNILTVNTGSSSVRLVYYQSAADASLTLLASWHHTTSGGQAEALLTDFLMQHDCTKVDFVVHRIVHGGAQFSAPVMLDGSTEAALKKLSVLAPLHTPIALSWISAARKKLDAKIVQIAVFDTGFYHDLPEIAKTYALPHELALKHGLRRYGFHGLAHLYMWQRWCELHPGKQGRGRMISLQLGSGCLITATENGKPLDTSMGFSPMEGLMMATRSGDVDPGIITYLQREAGFASSEIDELLNKHSGLLGVSGISADMRELLQSGEHDAQLAINLYCYRARKYLGAYLAVLGGVDTIVFGGGTGEHAPDIRARILKGMEWLGISMNPGLNAAATGQESRISADDSKIEVWVLPVDEAVVLAQQALPLAEQITSRR